MNLHHLRRYLANRRVCLLLAQACAITPSTIYRIRNGAQPTLSTLMRLMPHLPPTVREAINRPLPELETTEPTANP